MKTFLLLFLLGTAHAGYEIGEPLITEEEAKLVEEALALESDEVNARYNACIEEGEDNCVNDVLGDIYN